MIFTCLALAPLRAARPGLFMHFAVPSMCVVQHFMRLPDRFAVAGFLLEALRRYKAAAEVVSG